MQLRHMLQMTRHQIKGKPSLRRVVELASALPWLRGGGLTFRMRHTRDPTLTHGLMRDADLNSMPA